MINQQVDLISLCCVILELILCLGILKVTAETKISKALKDGGCRLGAWDVDHNPGLILGYMLADFDHRPKQERATIEHYLDWFYVADSLTELPNKTLGLLKQGELVMFFCLGFAHPDSIYKK